jgi:hypothetical protein
LKCAVQSNYTEFMANNKLEQRIHLKFLVKLKKTPTMCLKIVKDVYGDSFLSRAMVSMWHKRFSEGRNAVEDEEREGRPNTSKTNENVAKISEINRKDRCLSVRMITDMVQNDLNMTKVCAKMVPKNLTQEQKDARQRICSDTLERLNDRPDFPEKVITCDETWIFQCDPESKRPRIKKARMSKSKLKAMLIVFFFFRY